MKVCELIQSLAIHDMTVSKDKKAVIWHEAMSKNLYIDLEVKGQRRIKIMNVRDISSRGDTPMCQIWNANIKQK